MKKHYTIVSFYCFIEIEDPKSEVQKHHDFLKNLDVCCRTYISHEGINAQMSFGEDDDKKYLEWLTSDERFAKIYFKVESYTEHVFPKVTVKFREQLVALDEKPDMNLGGPHLSPEKWHEMLEKNDKNTVLLDVRNDYESAVGHFEGAEKPKIKTFREFPEYASELAERKKPKETKVMMYCTGGIRCELYSALLKEKGFKTVYQLDGGVINYGKKMGNKKWKGKLFVFDDRLSVPISDDHHDLISTCYQCKVKTDVYHNCANMDCNALFLSCPDCAEQMQGCCREACLKAPRLRIYEKAERAKPFKKWYHYYKEKMKK